MKRKNILLINSSQVLMDITRKILERAGYSVRIAVGLAGAREMLMDFMPDGIVLENDLPDISGLEYCRELRKENVVPIMFLSGSKDDEILALQAGANDFLKKPFDYEIFKARLGVMLNANVIDLAREEDDFGSESVDVWDASKADRRRPAALATGSGAPGQVRAPSGLGRVFAIAAACLVVVMVVAFSANLISGRSDVVEIPSGQVPLAEPPFQTIDENAVPYLGEETGVIIPAINNIKIRAGRGEAQALLLNPESNDCYLTFEIILEDGDEVIYQSGFIKPGMCLERITLARALDKGGYNAVMKISAYKLREFTEISNVKVDFVITAN